MTWHIIRNFGKVTYFNLSYIVLIGVPLLAEGYKAIYFALNNAYISIPFPVIFKIVYLSSLCYAIAIAFYQYFCPSLIKDFSTVQDYIDSSFDIYLRAHPDRKVEIVLANLMPTQAGLRDDVVSLHARVQGAIGDERAALQAQLDSLLQSIYPSSVQRFLVNQFETSMSRYPIAMWIAGVLYLFGTGLMLSILIHKTQVVFSV